MKIVRRTFSVLLCCVLLAAFAPLAHAEKTLIEAASATFDTPAAGETFDFNAVKVPDGAHYTAKAQVYYWKASKETVYLTAEDVIEKGVAYFVRVQFTADADYEFSGDKTVYTVNGEVIGGRVGTSTVEVIFIGDDKAPGPETPAGLTFGQRVVQFFHNIRDRIAHFFWTIRHLFGLV